jgi:hypothetical protein
VSWRELVERRYSNANIAQAGPGFAPVLKWKVKRIRYSTFGYVQDDE